MHFLLCLLFSSAAGQVDYSEQNFDVNEDTLEDVVKHRRFFEGLIMEAGRHVLFPDSGAETGMRYFEMKGQPEVEESYSNRTPRTGDCPRKEQCSSYKPVCGTDGKVYASECHLIKENCGRNVSSDEHWLKCLGSHYLCPFRCLDLNEPVCGSDLRIYRNVCLMRKRNCGKLLEKLPLTVCYERFNQVEECPPECLPMARPACGSNGLIYFNECFLRMRTCKQGIVEVPMDNCLFIPKCPQVCLPLYDPVCGSDGHLYTNYCRMLQTNCGRLLFSNFEDSIRTKCEPPSLARSIEIDRLTVSMAEICTSFGSSTVQLVYSKEDIYRRIICEKKSLRLVSLGFAGYYISATVRPMKIVIK